jgi:hypothetical protein
MRNAKYLVLIAAWLLTACVVQDNFPHNLQIGTDLQMTTTPQNAWSIVVPIHNINDYASSPAKLEMRFHFWTDGNGGSLDCTILDRPYSCVLPLECTRTLTFDVPSLQPGEQWIMKPVPISPAAGACTCLKEHCNGTAVLLLSQFDNPPHPAGTLCNTSILYGWYSDRESMPLGFEYDKNDCPYKF